MIISRYLAKEVTQALFAITVILLLIFLSNQLVRMLGYAASGRIAANGLLQIMAIEIPYLLALILPLGMFLGVLFAYGRLYSDNELRVMHIYGLTTWQLIGITSTLSLGFALFDATLALGLNPFLTQQKNQIIRYGLSGENIINTLMPGRFQVTSDERRVIYVEKMSRDHRVAQNLFIAEEKNPTDEASTAWSVLSAATGYQARDASLHERFLVATDGYRYEGTPGENDYKIIQFKKYAIRLPSTITDNTREDEEQMPSLTLLKHYHDPASAAELQWRFAMPLSVLLLALLAIPLSKARPRQGRYAALFPALVIYIIYINLLFVAREWIEKKTVPISIGIWWVHLLLFVVIGLFFYLRFNDNQSFWQRFKRRQQIKSRSE